MRSFIVAAIYSLLTPVYCLLSEDTASNGSTAAKWMTVMTSNGPITGHIAPNSKSVIEYLGIPYAKPPVGNLLFALPVKFTGNTPYEALDWASAADMLRHDWRLATNITKGIVRLLVYLSSHVPHLLTGA